MIDKWWILLDTCSTCNVTNNEALLTSIRPCTPQETLQVVTNGGGMIFKQQGRMKMFPLTVHYDQNSIATILSFHAVNKLPGVRVYYDNQVEDIIHVQLENGLKLNFHTCDKGLYYLDSTKLNISQAIPKSVFQCYPPSLIIKLNGQRKRYVRLKKPKSYKNTYHGQVLALLNHTSNKTS